MTNFPNTIGIFLLSLLTISAHVDNIIFKLNSSSSLRCWHAHDVTLQTHLASSTCWLILCSWILRKFISLCEKKISGEAHVTCNELRGVAPPAPADLSCRSVLPFFTKKGETSLFFFPCCSPGQSCTRVCYAFHHWNVCHLMF